MNLSTLTFTLALVCLMLDGTYGGPPSCDSLCIANGNVFPSPSVEVNNEVNISCDLGYTLSGSSNLTCFYNALASEAQWSDDEPTCTAIHCGWLSLTHGTVSYTDGYLFDSTASFTCNDDYEMSGASSVDCELDGSWSDNTPTCESDAASLGKSQFLMATSFVLMVLSFI